MDIFAFRDRLIGDYSSYIKSFIQIRDSKIAKHVEDSLTAGALWPEPLLQLNPSFESGGTIEDLIQRRVLHADCNGIFRIKQNRSDAGRPLRLHKHQTDAIQAASAGHNYVLTTGTASGKSLAYIVPIVDRVLKTGSGRGIQAIVVYPMNALANSQHGELEKFLCYGYPDGKPPVSFALYTGQESEQTRTEIIAQPPDILLTNYVMLELILTRPKESGIIRAAQGLQFLVLDELHTYRGRQGADVAFLVRRVRDRLSANQMQCVGTSATIAGSGTFAERQAEVASVASLLFGAEIKAEHVIGETLKRATPERDFNDPNFIAQLKGRLDDLTYTPPREYASFVRDPLSIWIESAFGVTKELDSGRLIRSLPKDISGSTGAANDLHQLTRVPAERCVSAIQEGLLAGYESEPNPETGFPVFAFRLHQFISRGDTVYSSVQTEGERYITLNGQQYVPGSRTHVLLPLVFCRECGQEYYCVHSTLSAATSQRSFIPRILNDQLDAEDTEAGFLYFSSTNQWPSDEQEVLSRVPIDWTEDIGGSIRLRSDRRNDLPEPVTVTPDGSLGGSGLGGHYLQAPFRFCLNCGVSYGFRQRNDFSKLASLGSEGRSTATTITSLSAVRNLRRSTDLKAEARKLLSFTDNRQDASLQAGHFNDFVEVGLLRSALYKAVELAGAAGLAYDELAQKVFDALNLPLQYYASDPNVRFQGLRDTQSAFREVLGYRVYRDLRRGWRITSPNLEQCGLLEIAYPSLDEVCEAEDVWKNSHPALVTADPGTRSKVASVLLDYMRRELAIKVNYLDSFHQERIKQQSSQKLIDPWALDENENMEHAGILLPRPRGRRELRENVFLSSRSGFGQYLRRSNTFPGLGQRLGLLDSQEIISQLFEALRVGGLVEIVQEAQEDGQSVPGYQVLASAMRWAVGDGTRAFHDPIRRSNEPEEGSRTNQFFVGFYRTAVTDLQGFEAREHTAQVEYQMRQEREQRFRDGSLPILYCSPTMELGVDIAQLNVVNMRNIPPTPANYAQRSGRAGRSGQPALVYSYCSTGSPHDQYFFRRPEGMVSGAVAPPRLDLANEDLVRAHVHAIWLAETGQSLGKSLKDILDLSGTEPTMELQESVRMSIESEASRQRARQRAERVLARIRDQLLASDWYSDRWLDEVLAQAARNFNQTCERWRSLYESALKQAKTQDRVIRDASRSPEDKKQAERLRREAESQLKLLTEVESLVQSDFYSYRYFASEGFLPGYNFPRLPISAYIPGRKTKQRDEFLSRPRFLAISEFGPRAFVYHEGSRYTINKVILPVSDEDLLTRRAKRCTSCGYIHPVTEGEGQDLCERCGVDLETPLQPLFRLQNVSTARRDKINSDEEERLRQGFEIITSIRFADHDGRPSYRTARVGANGIDHGKFAFGQSATIWRINLGWRRRKEKNRYGFVLDCERGYWAKNELISADDPEDIPQAARTARVIPYVEDTRNCLLFEPALGCNPATMMSLMAVLKRAVQALYQLEDNELAVEVLPSTDEPRQILFYEASEGGAGVLKRLVDDPAAFASVARTALEICHFDPVTGDDKRKAPGAREECEAACYDCLMNYFNQRFHLQLDRQLIRALLLNYARTIAHGSPVVAGRKEHLEQLMRLASSELERDWLRHLEERNHRLPSHAQQLIENCKTRPDFLFEEFQTAIYVDGPHHTFPERQARDTLQMEQMEDRGYTVIRFNYQEDWDKVISRYPNIFGRAS
ncbi:MAG TPA: DEAD/DEAH box helicase [Pyrinomonadaceae bacterium]|nr:DEAD/DEAH box helicase [Pyrinomonadaceae bacterium]